MLLLQLLGIYSLLSAFRELRVRESAILRYGRSAFVVVPLHVLSIYISLILRTHAHAHRMLGLPRHAMSVMIALQTLSHSVPGWLLGLCASVVVLHYAFRIFSSLTGLNLYFGLSTFPVLISSIYGVVVPLLVAVVILAGAMSESIVEGLLVRRAAHIAAITISRAAERFSMRM